METTSSATTTTTSAAPEFTGANETQDTTQTQAPATPILKEKFKIKVDGQEIEEEVDWNDKESIRKHLQLSKAAQKRMGEAGEAKKKALDIVRQFEENPQAMLSRLGPKGREIAEKFLLSQIEDEMLTPEQKEQRAIKAERDALKKRFDDEEARKNADAASAKENEYAQSFQQTIISALDKSGLPKTPELVKRMAMTMKNNLKFGLELTPDDLVVEVKKDITALLKSVVGDADGDHLLSIFGDDVANKIRKSDLKKLQEKNASLFQGGNKPPASGPINKKEDRPMSIEEWKELTAKRIQE